ncbi:MAG: hypothetical protein AB8H86_24225 [Polyangiales bacterium]
MWWDPRPLDDECIHARLGELNVWTKREPGEIVVCSKRDTASEEVEFGPGTPPHDADVRRFVMSERAETLSFQPRLAARSVVVRPRVPVFLPPGQHASIYVTTPLNAALFAGAVLLDELSIWDPPETWFGRSPVDGELCYASRTSGTRQRQELTVGPTRAATEVRLENQSGETLEARTIRLPVPRLTLAWDSAAASLVTETVRLIREDASAAELRIEALPDSAEKLVAPRQKSAPAWKNALAALWL